MHNTVQLKGLSVQEGGIEYGWSPANGAYTIRTWKGTQAEIQNLIPALVANGYEYQVKEGPLWTLMAKLANTVDDGGEPDPEVPVPQFELIAQRAEIDLLESSCPFVTYLKPEIIRLITQAVRNDEPPSFLTASYNSGLFTTATEKAVAANVHLHYISGIRTYTYYVPVLRKTYNASNAYVVNESITNVNRIHDTSRLISVENVPFAIRQILPPSGDFSVIVPDTRGLPANTLIPKYVGWLKGHPQYNQVGGGQFQITVDYEYGAWATQIYTRVV